MRGQYLRALLGTILLCAMTTSVIARAPSAAVAQGAHSGDEVTSQRSAQAAVDDYRQLDELLKKHLPAFEQIHEQRAERLDVNNLLASRQRLLEVLDRFETRHAYPLEQSIRQFQKHWGDGANGLNEQFQAAARRSNFSWSGAHTEIVSLLSSYRAYRVGLAGVLLRQARMHKALAESVDSLNMERAKFEYRLAKRYAELAVGFNPGSESGAAIVSEVDGLINNLTGRNARAIAAAQWPRAISDFAGPGNPGKLADAALKWINRKYATDYFAAYVCGNWYRHQTNLLDETLNYGIEMCMVRPDPDNSGLGVVSDVTLVTATARPEPVFRTAFFSDVTRINLAKAGTSPPWSASAHFATGLIDFLLSITAVGCGLLLTPRHLSWPLVTRGIDALSAHRGWFVPLSVAVAIVSSVVLLFDPLSDLLVVSVALVASAQAWLSGAQVGAASANQARTADGWSKPWTITEVTGVIAIGSGLAHPFLGWLPLV